jgi:hypothetical protein
MNAVECSTSVFTLISPFMSPSVFLILKTALISIIAEIIIKILSAITEAKYRSNSKSDGGVRRVF